MRNSAIVSSTPRALFETRSNSETGKARKREKGREQNAVVKTKILYNEKQNRNTKTAVAVATTTTTTMKKVSAFYLPAQTLFKYTLHETIALLSAARLLARSLAHYTFRADAHHSARVQLRFSKRATLADSRDNEGGR